MVALMPGGPVFLVWAGRFLSGTVKWNHIVVWYVFKGVRLG